MADPPIERPVVLISGIRGYIASWTAKAFLDAGYDVKGTARSVESVQPLLDGPLAGYKERISVFQVADIAAPGAFDEAAQGCHAIVHTASPVFPFDSEDPEPVMHTAVGGTKSILESARKVGGKTLKSFVFLSSIFSNMGQTTSETHRYSEADWNDLSEKEIERTGKTSSPMEIYKASKTAAERAVWEFREKVSPGFSVTSINPWVVWGPPLLLPEDPESIPATTKVIWTIFSGQGIPPSFGTSVGCVDPRDVARLLLFGVQESETAGGQRYIACAGQRSNQAVADILRKHYPDREDVIEAGAPGIGYLPDHSFPSDGISFDNSKAVKGTGKDWIAVEKTILDAAAAFQVYL